MMEERRKAKRVERPLNMRFCFSDEATPHWITSSVVINISVLGVKFIAPSDLKDKRLLLEIQSPRWWGRILKLQAVVLDSQPSELSSFFDIRAKFVDVSDEQKQTLSLLEEEQP